MAKQDIRLGKAVDEYLRYQQARRRAKMTVNQDRLVLNKFLRFVGDMQVGNLKPEHLDKFFFGKHGQMVEHVSMSHGVDKRPGIAPATFNSYRSRLKVFFTWCYTQGYIKRDHLLAQIEPMKVPRRVRQRPSPNVLLSLLDMTTNPRDRAYIATALNTGLRASEIANLRVGQVDLSAGYIHVIISKTKVEDEQPISLDLDVELRAWLTQYAEDLGRPLHEEDHLFPARIGGLIAGYTEDRQPIRQPFRWVPERGLGASSSKVVKQALERAGLPTRGEGTHTIRRAVARAYFDQVAQDKGDVAALRETAALLHHQSIATTERYLGTTPEKENRDRRLKGKPFLSAMVSQENVVPLRPKAQGE